MRRTRRRALKLDRVTYRMDVDSGLYDICFVHTLDELYIRDEGRKTRLEGWTKNSERNLVLAESTLEKTKSVSVK